MGRFQIKIQGFYLEGGKILQGVRIMWLIGTGEREKTSTFLRSSSTHKAKEGEEVWRGDAVCRGV